MLELTQTITELSTAKLEMFFLVLVRLSFMVFLFPFLGNQTVSARVKIGIVFFLALIFWPSVPETYIRPVASSGIFFFLVFKEALIGMILGFGSMFLTYFINMGGYMIGRDMGFMQAQTMDVLTGDMSDNVSNFLVIIFTMIFLITGGHHFFVHLMGQSFTLVPLAGFDYKSQSIAHILLLLSSNAFILGLKLASPVLVTLLLTQVGLAFVARVMPQMNIWILSIPLKIGLGVLVLVATLPLMYELFESAFHELQYVLLGMLKSGVPEGAL
jgi:flagellar biosynthetic protein FliR